MAEVELHVGPMWCDDNERRHRELGRIAHYWIELRTEALDKHDAASSWAVRVFERGEYPPSPGRIWIADPSLTEDDRIAFEEHAVTEGKVLADEAREIAAQLTARSDWIDLRAGG